MSARNPYAPSKASLKASPMPAQEGGVWNDDGDVLVAHGAAFPPRCVKCNAPAERPGKVRKVYWHHWTIYLLFLIYAIVYIVVALAVRKSMVIDPWLCEEHLRTRRKWIAIGWIGALSGLFVVPFLAALIGLGTGEMILLATTCFVGFTIAGVVNSRILVPKRIDNFYARLKGADRRFLNGLPKFQ